jgi:hypothetical protein
VAIALARLRELLASPAGAGLDQEPFWARVEELRRGHDRPQVRGAAAGLASTAGRLTLEDLTRDVAGHLGSSIPARDAVAFIQGLLATAREAVRLAFAGLTPRETDRVAEIVAALHGGVRPNVGVRRDIDEQTLTANLALSQLVTEALERDGLSAWTGAGGHGETG